MRSKGWTLVEPGRTENVLPVFFVGFLFILLLPLPVCKVAADTVALNPEKVAVTVQ